ncbi:hypothetical protein V8C35DRAFT_38639 [Trichoderma chlorosporum]
MQHFITQIADGHTEMIKLISHDGNETRQQIQQSESHVTDSINAVHAKADMETKRNRLLQSLKFESMNARRTDIRIADEATYISFFKSLDFEKQSTSSSAAAWKDFVHWLQSDEPPFWIQGKPGAGKSTLIKFLLQHENTHKALNQWNNNCLVASHFFWKPGETLQKSFKGLLCSFNHQLLFKRPDLIDKILLDFEVSTKNDSIKDWEVLDLQNIFIFILKNYDRPVFFLIDGVDESTEPEDVLKFLKSSTELPKTKWCISSRGEQIFQQAFSTYKSFKLHEYTRDDMLKFARKEIQYTLKDIQESNDTYSEQFLEQLQSRLVDKAEGVYLWFVLALKAVKKGLRNNDEKDDILLRLIKLPTEIEDLYADMWERLGEDKDIYQKEAAHYFKLLIENRSLIEEYQTEYGKTAGSFEWSLTPFQLMLTKEYELQQRLLESEHTMQLSEIEKKCSILTRGIPIKSAGLLITQDGHENRFSNRLHVKTEYSQLAGHATIKIDFVHRTLFDFLRDTEPGKNILAQAQMDFVYVQLATMMLCQLRVMKTTYSRQTLTPPENNILSHGGFLHYFRWLLNKAQKHTSSSKERVFDHILPAFEGLFETGLIPWDQRPKQYPLPCFDILLLGDSSFRPFIEKRLKSKGASYATRVLRDYMFVKDAEFARSQDLGVDVVKYFHELAADINSSDACFYELPGGVVANERITGYFTYESALSAFLKGLYDTDEAKRFYSPDMDFYGPMETLVAFLESSPGLNANTSCLLTPSRRSSGKWSMSLLLSVIAANKDKIIDNVPENLDSSTYDAVVIAEVNLKYLVDHFLKEFSSNIPDTTALRSRALQLALAEGSKGFVRGRFIVLMKGGVFSDKIHSLACYRFMNEDAAIFSDYRPTMHIGSGMREIRPKFKTSLDLVSKYISGCEKVDPSALFVLLDEKLGVCSKEL